MKNFILFVVHILIIPGRLSFPDPYGDGGKRLIQFSEEGPPAWLSPHEIQAAISSRIPFIDITDHQVRDLGKSPKLFGN